MAVLVDVDRKRRRGASARTVRVAGGQRLLAVLDAELREQRNARAPSSSVQYSLTSTCSGSSRRPRDGTHRVRTSRPSRAAELQLEATRSPGAATAGAAPCRPDLRARSSRMSAGLHAPRPTQLPDRQVKTQLALEIVQRPSMRGTAAHSRAAAGARSRRGQTDRLQAPQRALDVRKRVTRPSPRSGRWAPPSRNRRPARDVILDLRPLPRKSVDSRVRSAGNLSAGARVERCEP